MCFGRSCTSNVLTYVMNGIIYDENNWIGHVNELCA